MTYAGKVFVAGTLGAVKNLFMRKTEGGIAAIQYVPNGRFEIGVLGAPAFGWKEEPTLYLQSDATGINYDYHGTQMCQVQADILSYQKPTYHWIKDLARNMEIAVRIRVSDGADSYEDKIDTMTGWKRTAAGTLGW